MKTQIKLLTLAVTTLIVTGCSKLHNTNTSVTEIVSEPTISPVYAPAPVSPLSKQRSASGNSLGPQRILSAYTYPDFSRPNVNTEKYQNLEQNPVHEVLKEPISTFSIDVDTGSYANVRRFLEKEGRLPPIDAVRVEEMVNYFNYSYPNPAGQHPFSINTEVVDSPWKKNARLIKIGIKAKDIETQQLPPANLVFLIDISGSMDMPDKLPLVKKTLRLLTEQLRPQDKVTLITYASGEKLVLETTSGNQKDKILRVINGLRAGGSTAGESAIQLAYKEAEKSFIKNGINRILIATDGDFNVGITDFETLKGMVAEKRKSGISLTTLGFGTGNYNEKLMEQLADAGDGNYSYIDTEKEAKKVLQRQLSSTLATVAQDVKIQVEFNPVTVKEYRLVGYENRILKQEDFNNDRVDAGDIGAGHTVTAFYEIIPVGQKGWLNESRYQANQNVIDSQKNKEYAFLNLRYKQPQQKNSILLSQPITVKTQPLNQASEDTRFAIAVASYAQQLKGGSYNGEMKWQDIITLAESSKKKDDFGLRQEFIDLAKIAKSLSSSPKE
ncbi:vWA domain-containing protein [Acinetobacter stercoris]|uniref:von Willebrand factor n=1 Tax=Acinetobacter stercoris TaxID=2126983 RepID=A0A2U3MY95_9GAMM|nr:VWA domain-containing protein [Acinetobacter stercoris]SPL70400.1 von Willebrand factor [Acinetobacter stercoris]